MGYVRKKTGVQGQIDAANRNADAQIAATKQAADQAQQQLMLAAKAAAEQQAMIAGRMAAEKKASDAAGQPLDVAEVQLDEAPTQSAIAAKRSKRASFGRNYSTGVGI